MTKCYTHFWITNQRPYWWGKYKYWSYPSNNHTIISTLATRIPNNYIWCLKTVKKVYTNPLVFQGLFNDIQDTYFDHQFIYTDGSKDDHKVGCAVVSNFNIIKRRLPGQAPIYTAELCAIQLTRDVVNNSNVVDKYVICVDSLSCLQAIYPKQCAQKRPKTPSFQCSRRAP